MLQLACVEVGEKSVVAVASGAELRVRLCAKKRAEPSSAATPFWALEEQQPARYIPSACGAVRSHSRTQRKRLLTIGERLFMYVAFISYIDVYLSTVTGCTNPLVYRSLLDFIVRSSEHADLCINQLINYMPRSVLTCRECIHRF